MSDSSGVADRVNGDVTNSDKEHREKAEEGRLEWVIWKTDRVYVG